MKKAIFYRSVEEIKCMLLFMAGGFLFGMVLCFFIVQTAAGDEDVTSAMIASFLAWMLALMVVIFYGGIGMQKEFNLAVCMSHSRRRFLAEEGIVSAICVVVSVLVFLMLSFVDEILLSKLYADVPIDSEFNMSVFSSFLLQNPVNILCLIAIVVAVRFLFGMLYMRFGQMAILIVWVVTMTGTAIIKRVADRFAGGMAQALASLAALSARMNGQFFQIIAILISLVLIAVSGLLLGRQEVRNC